MLHRSCCTVHIPSRFAMFCCAVFRCGAAGNDDATPRNGGGDDARRPRRGAGGLGTTEHTLVPHSAMCPQHSALCPTVPAALLRPQAARD